MEDNLLGGQSRSSEIVCEERNCVNVCPHSVEDREREYRTQCKNCTAKKD